MYPKSVLFLGAGAAAREWFWNVRQTHPEIVVAFSDDVSPKTELVIHHIAYPVVKDWDVRPLQAQYSHIPGAFTEFLVGVAEPKVKKVLVEKALAHGLRPAPTLITQADVRPDCHIGRGGIIMNSICSTEVVVGDYTTIMYSTVSTDVRIADYVNIYAGNHLASDVVLEEGVCLGANTTVRERCRIAPWVVTGQCTCVVKSIDEPGITMIGLPAQKLERSKPGGGLL